MSKAETLTIYVIDKTEKIWSATTQPNEPLWDTMSFWDKSFWIAMLVGVSAWFIYLWRLDARKEKEFREKYDDDY